ncbi:anthranilate phosphoribosyltransferase [Acetobacter peroxydans]|jgi:anthranilate phosphoribosyltransferase|uniref:anthranilate phosphoribosyltransferase n=1 Tax=Acetobacter peroxydans TaxID=104098 RepID=UPI0023563BB6|nr:anthranilate phosphoribosyltransferase [Acetobacter peroxydans]MCH4142720.1 anthranilate phosphoribosyltransferase [Acetobacter peroxydans]MCI1394967.1 anthranilate phosphoribosyltransferase [Acetobacter peroxydans]MCI1411036.1 anthranilate phosphoribosyltransferase [Acetobacter peroxydans]MCI1440023.1 anthranilate phosphoribosyltransferase [Acetobacter peroxydans]MCI1566801.1 anthranilate phosphoribosyltransferase [Acetobacter peroxydans]
MSDALPDVPADSHALFTSVLERLVRRESLSAAQAEIAFGVIMDGAVSSERIAAFLMALRVRGETPDELLGAVTALRQRMNAVPDLPPDTVDVCGTGGDNYGTLNVSTAVAFVLAGAGVHVAKHGNRAVSSLSGASDVLSALGVPLLADTPALRRQMQAHRAIFLAAPNHHPAMRHAAQARKALGLPTLFNLVGPLVNPAGVRRQLVGVFSPSWLRPVVDVLARLGSERVWAVCGLPSSGHGGIDEMTLAGPTQVEALEDGRVHSFAVEPEMAGLAYAPVSAIQGGNAQQNAQALYELLRGAHGAYRDTVLLNAACALHVAGRINLLHQGRLDPNALKNGVADVASTLDNGAALAVLEGLRAARPVDQPER